MQYTRFDLDLRIIFMLKLCNTTRSIEDRSADRSTLEAGSVV